MNAGIHQAIIFNCKKTTISRYGQIFFLLGKRSDAYGDLYRVVVGDVGDAEIAVEGAEAEHLDVADEEVVYHRAFVLAEGVVADSS